jgi:hypothetical protein
MTPAEELRDAARIVRKYAGKATEGPWLALYATNDGWPIQGAEPGYDLDDDDDGEPSRDVLSLVCGTSLPRENGRLPGTYQTHHILAEHDDNLPRDQAAELLGSLRWAALLCPLFAEPLAAVFESGAVAAEQIGHDFRLLTLARVIRSQHQAIRVAQGGDRP